MAPVMWIEVLARDGHVQSRHRIDGDEARIGRAYDNDVVLDDPHVAAHHLRIARDGDGALVAEDLGSINGIYADGATRREDRAVLGASSEVRVGRTMLRVRRAGDVVAPEKPLAPPRSHAAWGTACFAAVIAALLVSNWLTITNEPTFTKLVAPLLPFLVLLGLWIGFWGLLGRVFAGHAQTGIHFRIACTATLALIAWSTISSLIGFSLAWRDGSEWATFAVWALLAATCYGHLRMITTRHLRQAMTLVVVLAAAGAALQAIGMSEAHRMTGQRATFGELLPPAFRVARVVATDDFLAATRELQRKVDTARKRDPEVGFLPDFDPE